MTNLNAVIIRPEVMFVYLQKMKRPKTKDYDKVKLQAAVRSVRRGKSLSKVASTFGIPKSTLYDHSKGKLIDSFNKPGVEPSLTDSEEQSLLNYMKYMAERGQPLTKSVLKQFVIAIFKKNGRPTSISMQQGHSKKAYVNFLKDIEIWNWGVQTGPIKEGFTLLKIKFSITLSFWGKHLQNLD